MLVSRAPPRGYETPAVPTPSVPPRRVMKLTTPAIASEPYSAEAPSASTSMRSIAEIGMLFRSMAFDAPVSVWPPKDASLLPFSSTSVRFSPRLWIDTPANP